MLQMVISRVKAVFSPRCLNVPLFFASNFNVDFLRCTNGDS